MIQKKNEPQAIHMEWHFYLQAFLYFFVFNRVGVAAIAPAAAAAAARRKHGHCCVVTDMEEMNNINTTHGFQPCHYLTGKWCGYSLQKRNAPLLVCYVCALSPMFMMQSTLLPSCWGYSEMTDLSLYSSTPLWR